MIILRVYQAKALKDLHKGISDSEVMQELHSFWAMKIAVQALGRAMSTLVVQEHHLWLNLAEMQDVEKASIAQGGLFSAQQFLAVKKADKDHQTYHALACVHFQGSQTPEVSSPACSLSGPASCEDCISPAWQPDPSCPHAGSCTIKNPHRALTGDPGMERLLTRLPQDWG